MERQSYTTWFIQFLLNANRLHNAESDLLTLNKTTIGEAKSGSSKFLKGSQDGGYFLYGG